MQCWPKSFKQGRIPDSLVRLKKFYHSQRITTWQTGRILPRILMVFQPAALANFSEQFCKTKQWKRKEHDERMSEQHIGGKNHPIYGSITVDRKHNTYLLFLLILLHLHFVLLKFVTPFPVNLLIIRLTLRCLTTLCKKWKSISISSKTSDLKEYFWTSTFNIWGRNRVLPWSMYSLKRQTIWWPRKTS